MLSALSLKNRALAKLSKIADFQTRKMIASGLIMSSLSYLIQVYGGCSGYLLNMLQVQQNVAARLTTKLPWFTSTGELLKQCGWLSVRQLIQYHSLILFHKVLKEKKPTYLYDHIKVRVRETRTTDEHTLQEDRRFKTVTASKSFIPRTLKDWNRLPFELRAIEAPRLFKTGLNRYLIDNTPVK